MAPPPSLFAQSGYCYELDERIPEQAIKAALGWTSQALPHPFRKLLPISHFLIRIEQWSTDLDHPALYHPNQRAARKERDHARRNDF